MNVGDAPGAEAVAVGFVRLLRAAGLPVSVDGSVMFSRALDALGQDRPDRVYWAARATLCRCPEEVDRFDECFRLWSGERRSSDVTPEAPLRVTEVGLDLEGADTGAGPDVAAPPLQVRYRPPESLRHRDFAAYTAADHEEARRALRVLRLAGPTRRSARLVPTSRSGRHPDLRRTTRAALRTEGEVLRRRSRTRATRPRRLVVLCDVSGSMEPYVQVIVRFVHAAAVARTRVEVFALGTRLTRLTRDLADRDPDAAIAAAARRVLDWSGGTRLGATIGEFNDAWGVRGLARGAIVVVISDGWDRGDPDQLAREMARLARVARRIVWVNPLKAGPGYEPLAAGMAAALPYVDEFLPGHSLAALDELTSVVTGEGRTR